MKDLRNFSGVIFVQQITYRPIPRALGWLRTSPMACLIRSSVGWNSRLIASVLSRSMPCVDQQISRLPYLRITTSTLPLWTRHSE